MTSWRSILTAAILAAVTFTVADARGGDRGDDRPQRTTRSWTGVVTVLQEDDFATGTTRTRYFMNDPGDEGRVRLEFVRSPASIRTGERVTVRGFRSGEAVRVESFERLEVAEAESGPVDAAVVDRSVVTLITDFADASVTCSDSSVADLMFGSGLSVDGLYEETSAGALGFAEDTNLDGQPDVYRVSIGAQSADPCDPYAWASAADAAASAAGINLSPFQHRLYVLPQNNECAWAGLASVGCGGTCVAWVATCQLPDVYAHELGHNLGLRHASTDPDNDGSIDCEYCDSSDFMGIGGVGYRHLNGPHKVQMGWLPPQQIVDIDSSGSQTLVISALDQDPGVAVFPQLVRLDVGSGAPYYISYRRQAGYDQNLSTLYAGRTNLHRYGGGSTNTLLIEALLDGESFTDAGSGVVVRQLSHDGSTSTVLVSEGCTAAPASLVLTPSTQSGAPGEALVYTATVTNNDSLSCASSTFDLTSGLLPGWTGNWSSSSLVIDPGDADSAQWTVTSAPSATEGDYTVSAFADSAGGQVTAVATYGVGGNAPDPPSSLAGASAGGRLIHLEWDTSGSGDVTFRVYRDGQAMVDTPIEAWSDWQVDGGFTYEYHVTAVDSAGRESDPSIAVQVVAGPPIEKTSAAPPGIKPQRLTPRVR